MHTSFDFLFEVNLTYFTRVLPLKGCGKIQLSILLIIYPNLSNPAFNYLLTVKAFHYLTLTTAEQMHNISLLKLNPSR